MALAITNSDRKGEPKRRSPLYNALAEFDWTPDLGNDIGSIKWFRGLFSLIAMCLGVWFILPGAAPINAAMPVLTKYGMQDELRSQMISPIAFGSDTGRAMAATDAVVALAESPERPQIELAATMGRGDSFARLMQRAGVGSNESRELSDLIGNILPIQNIRDGTRFDLVLGRRTSKNQSRPLDKLAFRARFDLMVEIGRNENNQLVLTRKPISVDSTPLRIRGVVGSSLYRSARAGGAPAKLVQEYLRTLGNHMSVGSIRSSDEFDIIIEYRRAETGEVEIGKLLYAGLERGGEARVQLMRWDKSNHTQWFEASGVGEQRGELARPVNGAISSRFGMRRHPILGYRRMHSGVDFRGGHGTPIYAATDGVVSYAGRKGRLCKFVRLDHQGGLATGYAHMSRIAVSRGTRVRQGQIIGYVGSTGLSTGPHLHYEMYKNGRTINPLSMRFTTRAQLSGRDLREFKNRLALLLNTEPGAALAPLKSGPQPEMVEKREISRLSDGMI